MWTLLVLGVFLAALWSSQAFRSTVAPDADRKVAFLALAVTSFGWTTWAALRPALIADERGLVIRNWFSTERLAWNEIAKFRLGRYKLLGAVCVIDLKNGSSAHASAIQVPNIARGRATTRESRMVAELNARLATCAGARS